jgi:hypothetical protein
MIWPARFHDHTKDIHDEAAPRKRGFRPLAETRINRVNRVNWADR